MIYLLEHYVLCAFSDKCMKFILKRVFVPLKLKFSKSIANVNDFFLNVMIKSQSFDIKSSIELKIFKTH